MRQRLNYFSIPFFLMEITITWKDKYSTLQNDRKINRSVAFHSFIYLSFHLSQCFHLANNLLWFIFSFKTSVVPCIVILKQISDPTHLSEKDSIPTAPCLGTFEGTTLFRSHDSCTLSPGCQGLHNVSSPPPSVWIFWLLIAATLWLVSGLSLLRRREVPACSLALWLGPLSILQPILLLGSCSVPCPGPGRTHLCLHFFSAL